MLATPHVFIFDNQRKLRYVGRVDNSDVGEVTSHDARNAIDALLAGKPVAVQTTRVFGCSTKWSDKRENAAEALKTWDAEPVELETIGPEGGKSISENKTNKLRLINLWATYCGPCVEELPELVAINRMYRKRDFEMITISLDAVAEKQRALSFLKERHVSAKNYLFNSTDRDKLAEAIDPKWPGPMPYTILVAPGGEVIYRQHGPLEPQEIKKAIVDYLGRTYAEPQESNRRCFILFIYLADLVNVKKAEITSTLREATPALNAILQQPSRRAGILACLFQPDKNVWPPNHEILFCYCP